MIVVFILLKICLGRTDLDLPYNDDCGEFRAKWIEIIINKGKNTIVGVIYRYPRKSHKQFQVYLNNTFNKIKSENKLLIIGGDFNYNLLNHEVDTEADDFIHTMLSNFCQPHITQPMGFVNNAKPSLLDNIFLIQSNMKHKVEISHLKSVTTCLILLSSESRKATKI